MSVEPAPILTSVRLRLRPHVLADFEAMCELWADAAVVRYISGRPSTREQTWARLLRHIGHWSALGFGYWVVEGKDDGRFLGEVGFGDFRRDLVPAVNGLPEAGWVLRPEAASQGIATEATGTALDWLDRYASSPLSFCLIDPIHTASLRVAEKLGFGGAIAGTCGGEAVTFLFRERAAAANAPCDRQSVPEKPFLATCLSVRNVDSDPGPSFRL
jgi:RimJ/RimL family protein N-acetyltransferase